MANWWLSKERDLTTYVPEERRPKFEENLKNVLTPSTTGQRWQELLVAVKVQIDEIVIRGYQRREQLGEGIKVLGAFLFVIDVAFLLCVHYVNRNSTYSLFGVDTMSGPLAMWIGAFFGGIGACLSGLMNFTVHRIARSEFEPFASTVIRPLIGATSGMLGVILAASGILNFQGGATFPGLAITAFILGFSERLVMGTVERLGTRAEARVSAADV